MVVHTSTEKITTCEILPQGKFVVIALDNRPNLVTLKIHNNSTTDDATAAEIVTYGNAENEANIFNL